MDDEAGAERDAQAFGRMFEQTYLRFHRGTSAGRRCPVPPAPSCSTWPVPGR
jgi:hypothetical protein